MNYVTVINVKKQPRVTHLETNTSFTKFIILWSFSNVFLDPFSGIMTKKIIMSLGMEKMYLCL